MRVANLFLPFCLLFLLSQILYNFISVNLSTFRSISLSVLAPSSPRQILDKGVQKICSSVCSLAIMPHFTAITLDRFVDAGASISADRQSTMKVPIASPINPKPWDYPRRKVRPLMNPALYATPKSTPAPDLPSSFPPSPYIINHKGRGPSVVKKDDASASSLKKNTDEARITADENGSGSHNLASVSSFHVWVTASDSVGEKGNDNIGENSCDMRAPDTPSREADSEDFCDPMEISPDTPDSCHDHIGENSWDMSAPYTPTREADGEDFCDPHESMSYTSNKVGEEFCIPGHSSRLATPTPGVEFYDAWEELSSDGTRIQNSVHAALEEELREIRLSVMMEIEKRKQSEEALEDMQRRWQRMREQLSLVGLTILPTNSSSLENETEDPDPAEEICQQVHVVRFVSEAIGRGTAKAEAAIEMENRLEAKNFEIARLCDRLHYYEAVNHEMSQRNQQVVEGTRRLRLRQRRKRRQRWMWGSIAVTIMSIGVAFNYLQTGKASSTTTYSRALEHCSIEG